MMHSAEYESACSIGACRDELRFDRPVAPVYRVGELLQRRRRTWPEGSQFSFGPGCHELTLFYQEIDDDLVDGVRRGSAEFALIVVCPVIVLAYRFGESILWSDVPYSWHLQASPRRFVPALVDSPETRSLLWITLVGAGDGIIHAQRGMTLSPAFTRALHEAIRTQAMSPFRPEACTKAISRIYLKHPRTVDRLAIATARTMGNA
jgi:hypothetical protein